MQSPKLRYYLENQKQLPANQRIVKEPIMVEIGYGYVGVDGKGNKRTKPFRISLKKSIEPFKFGLAKTNFKFDRGVFEKATKNNASIRTAMSRLVIAVDNLDDRYTLKDVIPEPAEFKKDLLIELGRNERVLNTAHSILDYLYSKIEKSVEESDMDIRNSLSPNTIKTYKTISHLIENYQLATNEIITFESFNNSQYWKFWKVLDDILKDEIKIHNPNQLRKQTKQWYGYLSSTVRKYQGGLIRTMKDALEDDEFEVEIVLNVYNKNLVLEKQEASKDIYISEEELQSVLNYDVEFDEELQMVKDYIIIGSLTGMRFESMSDTKNSIIQEYNEDGYNFKYIHSKQNKTSTEIFIPLLAPVLDILKRYGNKFPVYKQNPTINKHLKRLFKELKIDRMEDEILKTYKSGTIKLKKPFYELITTHDSKKTFYTNLYNLKVLPRAIDNMTHPDTTKENRMAKVYNKARMIDKAKMFVDEINKIKSVIYKF